MLKLFLQTKIHYVPLIEKQIKANTRRQAVTVVCTHLATSLQNTRVCRSVIQNPGPEYFVHTSIFNILGNLCFR